MKKGFLVLALIVATVLMGSVCFALESEENQDRIVPSDEYPTITDALKDNLQDGTDIIIMPGVYSRDSGEDFPLEIDGKDEISIKGQGGVAGLVKIEGDEGDTIFKVNDAENIVFKRLRLSDADTGIYAVDSLIDVKNCIFNNLDDEGIKLKGGPKDSPDVEHTIYNCVFNNIDEYGIYAENNDYFNLVMKVDCSSCIFRDIDCGIYFEYLDKAGKDIRDPVEPGDDYGYNDFWNMHDEKYGGSAEAGEGDHEMDPLFGIAFRLKPDSPCLDQGHPGEGWEDLDGTRNDMGAYGGPGAWPAAHPVHQLISAPGK